MKNYYKILEVNKSASPEVIGKVYKYLAKKYHPDANPTNKLEAEEKFKEISEAYEILSDEYKRKNYDLELEEFENQNNFYNAKFQELQNYCQELENEIMILKSQNNPINYYQPDNYQNSINYQATSQNYNNEYLKNSNYIVNFKAKIKNKLKDLLALIIALTFLYFALKFIANSSIINDIL